MKTIIKCAFVALATVAAVPAMAQSNEGRGGGGGGGGGSDGSSSSRLDRINTACLAAPCDNYQRPRYRQPVTENCSYQLTYGRNAIFYYKPCDVRR